MWHMRLGHMSGKGMGILSKRGLLGSPGTSKLELCENCGYGKQKKVSSLQLLTILDYIDNVKSGEFIFQFID